MIPKEKIESWITNGPDNEILTEIDDFGNSIRVDVTRAQIRQIFSKMKNIEAKGAKNSEFVSQRSEFLMLKPLIAYAAGRQSKNKGLNELKIVLTEAIDCVAKAKDDNDEWKKRFRNFCKMFEAIFAYHRAHGGN